MGRREPSEGSLTGETEHRIMRELESLKDLECWTFYFTGRKNTTSPKATQPNPLLSLLPGKLVCSRQGGPGAEN